MVHQRYHRADHAQRSTLVTAYEPLMNSPTRITIGFSSNIHIWENEKKTILAAWILDLLNWLHRFL
jgi:hypothetical protein